MSKGIEIRLVDKSALDAFDQLLNSRQRRNVITKAKRAAGNVIRAEASKRAPVGKPRMWRGIRRPGGTLKSSLKTSKSGIHTTRVGNVYVMAMRTSKQRGTQGAHSIGSFEAYYAYWVEKGHGGQRGPAKARPFMIPAFRAKRKEASDAFAAKFKEGVDLALGKMVKRSKARRR